MPQKMLSSEAFGRLGLRGERGETVEAGDTYVLSSTGKRDFFSGVEAGRAGPAPTKARTKVSEPPSARVSPAHGRSGLARGSGAGTPVSCRVL
jgi:hypothetical protein